MHTFQATRSCTAQRNLTTASSPFTPFASASTHSQYRAVAVLTHDTLNLSVARAHRGQRLQYPCRCTAIPTALTARTPAVLHRACSTQVPCGSSGHCSHAHCTLTLLAAVNSSGNTAAQCNNSRLLPCIAFTACRDSINLIAAHLHCHLYSTTTGAAAVSPLRQHGQ